MADKDRAAPYTHYPDNFTEELANSGIFGQIVETVGVNEPPQGILALLHTPLPGHLVQFDQQFIAGTQQFKILAARKIKSPQTIDFYSLVLGRV